MSPPKLCGITPDFSGLSPASGQVAYALLDRSPLESGVAPSLPLDLHFSGMPQAFVLSQDQTLHQKLTPPGNGRSFDPPFPERKPWLRVTSLMRVRSPEVSPRVRPLIFGSHVDPLP